MLRFGQMDEQKFKEEICTRCDIVRALKRKQVLLSQIFDEYESDIEASKEIPLKYLLGSEGVRDIKPSKCQYVTQCDTTASLIDEVAYQEECLSKLLYYFMSCDKEKEVYYISSAVTPFYPLLANRIIRCKNKNDEKFKEFINK